MEDLLLSGITLLFDIADVLLSFLPNTPFVFILSQIGDVKYLNYVNYFIPFKFCATCLNAWLACVTTYYIYKYLKEAINKYRFK